MKLSLARAAALCAILSSFAFANRFAYGGTEEIRKPSTYLGPPRLHIVSIGVPPYAWAPALKNDYSINDATSIADAFRKRGEGTYVDLSLTIHTITGTLATRANILKALDQVAADASTADTFVFFFAGAGLGHDNDYAILPADYSPASPDKAVSNTILQSYFRRIRAAHRLMIMDSGPFAPDASSINELFIDGSGGKRPKVEGDLLLLASENGSTERAETKHGTITEILLKGLEGPADFDGDGLFSSGELEAYFYKGAIEYKKRYKFDDGFKFRPLTVSRGDDFTILLGDAALRIQKSINDNDTALEELRDHDNDVAELERKERETQQFLEAITLMREHSQGQTKSLLELSATDLNTWSAWIGRENLDLRPDGYWQLAYDKALALAPKAIDRRKAEITILRSKDSPGMQRYKALIKVRASLGEEWSKLVGGQLPQMLTRSDEVPEPGGPNAPRTGKDYALLIANTYDNNKDWRKLTNPHKDVDAIKRELIDHYGYDEKNVEIALDLTAKQINDKIDEYRTKFPDAPKDDSQLFVFIAGHGYGNRVYEDKDDHDNDLVDGYFIGQNSPGFRDSRPDDLVSLETLLSKIAAIKIKHIFVAFDSCFAGVLWHPDARRSIRSSRWVPELTSPLDGHRSGGPSTGLFDTYEPIDLPMATGPKDFMKKLSRVSLTSGDGPVFDAWKTKDGTLSEHSPFAEDFLRALRSGGNSEGNSDNILTTGEIQVFTANYKQADRGFFGGLNANGDFVFIYQPKKP